MKDTRLTKRHSIMLFVSMVLLLLGAQASAQTTRPNVLFILTDDQGYGDLSLHGNPFLKTPAMDSIGKEGMRLDRFYVSPVCAPTRASLLTGRYHLRTGATGVTRRAEVLSPSETTIAELFSDSGYATACFGKWHNGSVYPETPNGQGFDEFLGILGGLTQRYFDPELVHNGERKAYSGYITEILGKAAIDWMDVQAAADRPFFCYVPFNAPHTPGLVQEKYWKPFYKKNVGRWESVIYGMIHVIDEQVARMLQFLEDKNLANNTIVIFMTDNGPATFRYNAGLRDKKGSVYDGGTRVPCFIRWPGKLKPNTMVDLPLAHIDILPTLAEWCDLELDDSLKLDGKSFASLAQIPGSPWPDRKLMSFSQGSGEKIRSTGAVHTNRWTAVMQRGRWELFDINADIRQRKNMAANHPEILTELRSHFEKTLATMPPLGTLAPVPLNASAETVLLEGHDAILTPKYKGNGIDYNFPSGISHQWISKWTNTQAYPEWNVDVAEAGRFNVSLRYCIPKSDLGVKAYLEIQGQRLPINITEAFSPPSYPQPFLLDGESVKYESKDWKEIPLGQVSLKKGMTTTRIQVTDIPGEAAMEVKEIVLKRL